MEENTTPLPERKVDLMPYEARIKLDKEQMQIIQDWLKGPQVECWYGSNPETDYLARFTDHATGKDIVTRVCDETVTINGVTWFVRPGKNILPRPVYEFMLTVPQQAHMFYEMDENGNMHKARPPQSSQSDPSGRVGRELFVFT